MTQDLENKALASKFDPRVEKTVEAVEKYFKSKGKTRDSLIFGFLWRNQARESKLTPAAISIVLEGKVEPSPVINRLRDSLKQACLSFEPDACPMMVTIESQIYRLKFTPRGEPIPNYRLDQLHWSERVRNGHLLEEAEVMIYLDQAGKIDDQLKNQMIRNMEERVTYRYYVPVRQIKETANLVLALVQAGALNRLSIDQFRAHFQVNLILSDFPLYFSIHNATHKGHAIFFVRTVPGGTLLQVCTEQPAWERAEIFRNAWQCVDRTKHEEAGIIEACTGTAIDPAEVASLHRTLTTRLERLGFEGAQLTEICRKILPSVFSATSYAQDTIPESRRLYATLPGNPGPSRGTPDLLPTEDVGGAGQEG